MNDLRTMWGEALLSLLVMKDTGESEGVGNAFVISAQDHWALVMTADHNIRYIESLAVCRSGFATLAEAKDANPSFRSRLREIWCVRKLDGCAEAAKIPHFSRPLEGHFDAMKRGYVAVAPDELNHFRLTHSDGKAPISHLHGI